MTEVEEVLTYPGFIEITHAEAGCKNKVCVKHHWKADLTTTRDPLPRELQGELDFLTSIATCIISGHPIRSMVFSMISDEANATRSDVGQVVALVGADDVQRGPSYPHQTMLYGKAIEDTPLLNAAINVSTMALVRAKRQLAHERAGLVPVQPFTTIVAPLPGDLEMVEPPANEVALDESGYPPDG